MRKLAFLILFSAALWAQIPNAYPIFDKDAVHEIRLTFANSDWYQVLESNYDGSLAENPYFEASLEWGSNHFDTIGVRFKGNSSYNGSSTTGKRPFRLKLNEFVKGQKIDGIGSFSLSNAWNDPSFLREKLYYEMAAALGIKAPRSNFAALYINGEYWGLYILTEVINGDFLKNYYGKNEDTGNLYKANMGASFAYLGESVEAYGNYWEKQSNEDLNEWGDLIQLSYLIDNTPQEEFQDMIQPNMDVDSVLATLALDNATVNLDSYVGMGQNFNIYRRPSDWRWIWVPWDPSLAFGGLSQGQTQQGMIELPLEWTTGSTTGGGTPPTDPGTPPTNPGTPPTNPGTPPTNPGTPPTNPGAGGGMTGTRPLATKLWAVPEYKERYRQIYQQLMDQVFLPAKLIPRMRALHEMISPFVATDQRKLVSQEQFNTSLTSPIDSTGAPADPAGGGGMGAAPGLEAFVTSRAAWLKQTLAAEQPLSYKMMVETPEVHWTQVKGATAPSTEIVVRLDGTSTTGNFTVFATTDSGTWLAVSPAGGVAPGSFRITVNGKPDPGTYNGQLRVYSPGASNSPILIPVSLTVVNP